MHVWRSLNGIEIVRAILTAFLLLCGDVVLNPGPPKTFLQGICSLVVTDSDAVVCCNYCKQWSHVACDQLLSTDEYEHMVNNPRNGTWFCFECQACIMQGIGKPNLTISTLGTFSCVSLNARSVVFKRFDLFAFVIVHNFDVAVVTKSFIHDSHITTPGYTVFYHDHSRSIMLTECI